MCNASGHNYRNSSFIVDVAMGRYHVLQDVFLVTIKFQLFLFSFYFSYYFDFSVPVPVPVANVGNVIT